MKPEDELSGDDAGPIDIAFSGRLGTFDLDIAFQAPGKGVTALFGPSGCGKTSVLRAVAGLQRLAGHCRLGASIWQDETRSLPTHRRPIGYVFQEASLFPHLSVRGNPLDLVVAALTGMGLDVDNVVFDHDGLQSWTVRQ